MPLNLTSGTYWRYQIKSCTQERADYYIKFPNEYDVFSLSQETKLILSSSHIPNLISLYDRIQIDVKVPAPSNFFPTHRKVCFSIAQYMRTRNASENASIVEKCKNSTTIAYLQSNHYLSNSLTYHHKKYDAVILYSGGKESVLTYEIMSALGFSCICLIVENEGQAMASQLAEHLRQIQIPHVTVKTNLCSRDSQWLRSGVSHWMPKDKKDRRITAFISGTNIHYAVIAHAFAEWHQAQYILSGDELECQAISWYQDLPYVKNWMLDQSPLIYRQWHKLFSTASNRKIYYGSVVASLSSLLIGQLLFNQIKAQGISSYYTSCRVFDCGNSTMRWCLSCPKCFYIYLIIHLFDIDVTVVGMGKNQEEVEKKLIEFLIHNKESLSDPIFPEDVLGIMAKHLPKKNIHKSILHLFAKIPSKESVLLYSDLAVMGMDTELQKAVSLFLKNKIDHNIITV